MKKFFSDRTVAILLTVLMVALAIGIAVVQTIVRAAGWAFGVLQDATGLRLVPGEPGWLKGLAIVVLIVLVIRAAGKKR